MLTLVQPQEEMKMRLGRKKCIVLTGPGAGGRGGGVHHMPCRATEEASELDQVGETGVMGKA